MLKDMNIRATEGGPWEYQYSKNIQQTLSLKSSQTKSLKQISKMVYKNPNWEVYRNLNILLISRYDRILFCGEYKDL
jgi:hypothetical protein